VTILLYFIALYYTFWILHQFTSHNKHPTNTQKKNGKIPI